MVSAVLDLATEMGLNTLRTWAFRDGPGTPSFQYWDPATKAPAYNDGPQGLRLLDRTIAWCEQRGLRLILPLVNYWDDFGGMREYGRWFGFRERDSFYTEPVIRDAYRAWAQHLLTRTNSITGRQYRDEPAILAWELANEPRCTAADGINRLLEWATEMSGFLRSLDPNHLIGVG